MDCSVISEMILSSVLETKKKVGADRSLPAILRDCLKTAGISFHGSEAQQIHLRLFSSCFASFDNHKLQAEKQVDEDPCFSAVDYFLIIVDDELQWFSFYVELLPYLRLPVIIEVVSNLLVDHCLIKGEETGSNITVMDVCLMTSSLEMFAIVFIDLLTEPDKKNDSVSDAKLEELNTLGEKLSKIVAFCFHFITEVLSNEEFLLTLINNPTSFQNVIDMLSFFMTLLNTTYSVEDVINLIKDAKQELVWKDLFHESSSHLDMKEIVWNKSTDLIRGKSDVTASESAPMEGERHKPGNQEFGQTVAENSSGNYGSHEKLNQETAKDKYLLFTNAESSSPCHRLLVNLRRRVNGYDMVDMMYFLDRWAMDYEDFQATSCYLVPDDNPIKIGHYVLNRPSVFLRFNERYNRGQKEDSLDLAQSGDHDNDPNRVVDLSSENEDGIFKLLKSHTADWTKSLDLVKTFVNDRESGWQELLSMGMRKTDIENWWNVGFYDLVQENVNCLSNETNIRHLLDVLHHLSIQQPVIERHVKSMTQLFTTMYNKLPLLLQEHLVVSTCTRDAFGQLATSSLGKSGHSPSQCKQYEGWSPMGKADFLSNLKTEKQVLKELTPLLNKLTVGSVREIAPCVLKLCLYQSEAVVKQMLHVAVRNAGQILPVVELLRQIPRICTDPHSRGIWMRQSRVCGCLLDILSGTSLDEKETENVIAVITNLCTNYTMHVAISKRNLLRQQFGILTIEEVLLHFIYPGIAEALNLERREHVSDDIIMPGSTSLSCLTSVVTSLNMERFDSLEYLVLIDTVVEVFVRNFTVFYADIKGHQSLVIKQRAFACLESLVEKGCANSHYFSDIAVQTFVDRISKSGLLALVLCYPLLKQTSHFQMLPLLKELAEGDMRADPRNAFQSVIRLLQFGLVNEMACLDVVHLFQAIDDTVSQKQLTAVYAHILSQSLPCQMTGFHRMALTLMSRMTLEYDCLGPRGNLVSIETRPYLLFFEMLCDALFVLHSRRVLDVFLRHFVSNFQTVIQGLLSSIDHENLPDVHYFLFYQCCLIMCTLNTNVCQGVRVLALSTLKHWSNWLRLKASHAEINTGKKSDGQPPEEKMDCKVAPDASQQGDDDEAEILEKTELAASSWSLQDVSTLMDVAACIRDDDVQGQLMKQLQGVKDEVFPTSPS